MVERECDMCSRKIAPVISVSISLRAAKRGRFLLGPSTKAQHISCAKLLGSSKDTSMEDMLK